MSRAYEVARLCSSGSRVVAPPGVTVTPDARRGGGDGVASRVLVRGARRGGEGIASRALGRDARRGGEGIASPTLVRDARRWLAVVARRCLPIFLLSLLTFTASRAEASCTVKYGPYGVLAVAPDVKVEPTEDAPNDVNPPTAASIRDVRVVWVDNGTMTGGPGGCPDVDTLSFVVDGGDEISTPDKLRLLAFIGADEASVNAKSAADIFFQFSPTSSYEHRVTVVLGNAAKHERSGEPFRSADPFCFSIAMVDEAGNVGGRSSPTCLTTVDPSAEYVTRVDAARGCGCSSLSELSMLALMGSLGWMRRRGKALRRQQVLSGVPMCHRSKGPHHKPADEVAAARSS